MVNKQFLSIGAVLLIAAALFLFIISDYARADETRVRIKSFNTYKRYACYPFTINFGGFLCHTRFCSYSSLPSVIRGTPCGIPTVCYRRYGRFYHCSF